MLFPVVGQALVELAILFLADVIWIPGPDGLGLVKLFIFGVFLLDGLFLLLVARGFVGVLVFTDILDLGGILSLFFLLLLLLIFSLVVRDFLVPLLLDEKLDGIPNELRVFLDNVLDALLLMVLSLVLLHVEHDLGATAQRLAVVRGDGERASSRGLPHILFIVVVLGIDHDLVSHEVGRVEAHTELTNHGGVSSSLESLHERLGARLGDGTQVVDKISLGHANTGINDGEGLGLSVGNNLDVQLLGTLQLGGVSERLVPDLVQSIARVGNQLTPC